MELREYQKEAVSEIVSGNANKLLVMATGAGKTIVMAYAIKELASKGLKCLILAHRSELIKQAHDKLKISVGLDSSVFSASLNRKEIGNVTVASIQSLSRAELKEGMFDIIFVDECHLLPSKSKGSMYKKTLEELNCKIVGVTATPFRTKGLIYGNDSDKWFKEIAYNVDMRALIDDKFLSEYKHKLSAGTQEIRGDLGKVGKSQGDYKSKELGEMMGSEIYLGTVTTAIKEYGQDRNSIVVFCVNIEHAEAMKDKLINEGEYCVIVHSKMKTESRDLSLWLFDKGLVRWLINVSVLVEGWDCTRVDCIVMARPTKSTAMYVQQAGRGLRLHHGKEDCLILDVVGNYLEHGLIESPNFRDEKKKEKDAKEPECWICEKCFSIVIPELKFCECGAEKPKAEKKEIEFVDDKKEFIDVKKFDKKNICSYDAKMFMSKAGFECVKLDIYLSIKGEIVNHYYRLDSKYTKKTLARIVNKYSNYDVGLNLSAERFIKCVQGNHLKTGVEVKIKENNGFKKVVGF